MRKPPVVSRLASLVGALVLAAPGTRAAERLPTAEVIRSVWDLGSQPCNGGLANAYTRSPNEKAIRKSGRVELPEIGFAFQVPQVFDKQGTVVKLHLNDRSRRVVDHYFLLAEEDLAPPLAAIVVTELPEEVIRDHKAFEAVRILQSQLARAAGFEPELTPVSGPHGDALEMIVPDRGGTDCFPTSEFQRLPEDSKVHTTGISRFVVIDDRLVEFAVIMRNEPDEAAVEATRRARDLMDRFWLALERLPAKH